jgi:hypothetical protein
MNVTAFIRKTSAKDKATIYFRVRDEKCDIKCASELTINPNHWDSKRQSYKQRIALVKDSERQQLNDGLRVVNPTGNVTPHSSFIEEPPITEQPSSTTSEELNEKNDEFLEHIEPEHQCSYLSEEFMQNLNNKHNTRKIEKKNARDKL